MTNVGARIRRAWRRERGWWRLAAGFCPECNSSPPRTGCPVCDGDYAYGPSLSRQTRDVWQTRWDDLLAAEKGIG